MAQQTRLEEFVRRFPDLAALAAATEEEVLELWSGLGYYRRARNLHRLARRVAAGSGRLPTTAAELETLPGIGPYTAAAIASLAHGEAVPVMDGNIARVGARVLALPDDPRKEPAKTRILEWVEGMMVGASPGEVNEALMELGATICARTRPRCSECPLGRGCRARLEGDPEAYPPPRQARAPVLVRWLVAVVEDAKGRWMLRRVSEGPILLGLWLPPFAERDDRRSLEDQIRALVPVPSGAAFEEGSPIRHSITHRRIEITPVRVRVEMQPSDPDGCVWADPETPDLPTSSLLAKLVGALSSRRRSGDRSHRKRRGGN
jgi:A/G-specific adenine glycosylase